MSIPYSFLQTMVDVPYDQHFDGLEQATRFLSVFKNNINTYEDTDEKLRTAIYLYFLFHVNISFFETEFPHQMTGKQHVNKTLLNVALNYLNEVYPEDSNPNLEFITIPSHSEYKYCNMKNVETEITFLEREKSKRTGNFGTVLTDNINVLPTLQKFSMIFQTPINCIDRVKLNLEIDNNVREKCANIFAQYIQRELEFTAFDNIPFLRTETKDGETKDIIFKGRLFLGKMKRPHLKYGEEYIYAFDVASTFKSCVEYPVEGFNFSVLNFEENITPYNLTCVYLDDDVRVGFNHKGRQIEIENSHCKFNDELIKILPYIRDALFKYKYSRVMTKPKN